jgi:hypothetical protein
MTTTKNIKVDIDGNTLSVLEYPVSVKVNCSINKPVISNMNVKIGKEFK